MNDIVGIGSALLDFIVEVDDTFLEEVGVTKGQMQLVDAEQSKKIFEKLKDKNIKIAPGGSVANTVSGVSILGGNAFFFGKVGNDDHGNEYE